jgi:uncharacterized CHY-type Zn-finger protein
MGLSVVDHSHDKCRLCFEVHPLRNSHFLPRGMYKVMRDTDDPKHVILRPGRTSRTTKQVRDYLLCDECEERFNSRGERWVLANGLQKCGEFPLQAMLKAAEPTVRGEQFLAFSGLTTPGVSADSLVYFAASVFWRSAVHDWGVGHRVNLGVYEEQLRRYLLGLTGFPQHAALVVFVTDQIKPIAAATTPSGGRVQDGSYFQYKFHLPGLQFFLVLGQRMHQSFAAVCAVRSRDRLVLLSPKVEDSLKEAALKLMEAPSTPN